VVVNHYSLKIACLNVIFLIVVQISLAYLRKQLGFGSKI